MCKFTSCFFVFVFLYLVPYVLFHGHRSLRSTTNTRKAGTDWLRFENIAAVSHVSLLLHSGTERPRNVKFKRHAMPPPPPCTALSAWGWLVCHGAVKLLHAELVVFPASLEASVEKLRLPPTRLQYVSVRGDISYTALDVR